MDTNTIGSFITHASVEDFDLIMEIAAQRITEMKKNDGKLPYKTWLATLKMAGFYPCLEVLIVDRETGNLLMLVRDATDKNNEAEWSGNLHIPGISITSVDNVGSLIQKLLEKEVIDPGYATILAASAVFRGVLWYDEPQRNTTAITLIIQVTVDRQLLKKGFVPVTKRNLHKVILQHKPTWFWWKFGCVPFFLDLRYITSGN